MHGSGELASFGGGSIEGLAATLMHRFSGGIGGGAGVEKGGAALSSWISHKPSDEAPMPAEPVSSLTDIGTES